MNTEAKNIPILNKTAFSDQEEKDVLKIAFEILENYKKNAEKDNTKYKELLADLKKGGKQ